MARKTPKKTKSASPQALDPEFTGYLIPSVIGGVIAWVLSGSLGLGVIVFVALMLGNYFGTVYRNHK